MKDARDQYVYLYTPNEESAYKASDHMILVRVHKKQIKNREGYEYFTGFGKNQKPCWSENYNLRKPVFSNPGRCYRSGISYNPGLKRYLWCQIIPVSSSWVKGAEVSRGTWNFRSTRSLGTLENRLLYTELGHGSGRNGKPACKMDERGREIVSLPLLR